MPQTVNHNVTFTRFASNAELPAEWRTLADEAEAATQHSYSPYSRFKVGCALRLSSGRIMHGTNQENVAYPSGLCAERSAFYGFGSTRTNGEMIEAVAVTTQNLDGQQGMPPKLKEIVVSTNALNLEQLRPYLRYRRFNLAQWRLVGPRHIRLSLWRR